MRLGLKVNLHGKLGPNRVDLNLKMGIGLQEKNNLQLGLSLSFFFLFYRK